MEETKRNWKQELKDFWNENKGKFKVGAVCLGIGTFYGFVKGMTTEAAINSSVMNNLIGRIPLQPDPDDDIPPEEL